MSVDYRYDTILPCSFLKSLSEPAPAPIWRYSALLPTDLEGPLPRLAVGGTPLYRDMPLGKELGIRELMVKDDGLNPTGSSKDRASCVAVAMALKQKASTISCASTGNAASSCAGSAASAGMRSVIFVPRRAPQAKLVQLLMFGAVVVRVDGDYADAFKLSAEAILVHGWYNRNAAINPYMIEGKKTVSYEIAEGMKWEVPDWVVVSVGDGCTIAGVGKGFRELARVGVIGRQPRLLGVQARGANAISLALRTGRRVECGGADTFADSIAVAMPRNGLKAIEAVRNSRGTMVEVSDEAIAGAMLRLGRSCGIFAEPAASAGLAGLESAIERGIINSNDTVCLILTGNGLKDVASGASIGGEPIDVPPELDVLEKALMKVAPEVL